MALNAFVATLTARTVSFQVTAYAALLVLVTADGLVVVLW